MKVLLVTAFFVPWAQQGSVGITLVQGTAVFPPPTQTYTIETTVAGSDECKKRGGEWKTDTKTCVIKKKQESGN